MGRVLLAVGATVIALLALILLTSKAVFVLLFFCAFAVLILAMLIDRGSLVCPNCHKPPLTTFERGPAASADFCPHCHVWLKAPYASHNGQV